MAAATDHKDLFDAEGEDSTRRFARNGHSPMVHMRARPSGIAPEINGNLLTLIGVQNLRQLAKEFARQCFPRRWKCE